MNMCMHDGFSELCYHLGYQYVNSECFVNCDVNPLLMAWMIYVYYAFVCCDERPVGCQ